MFNAVTDAVQQMENQNFCEAKAILMQAQIECESLYIEGEETKIVLLEHNNEKNDEK